MEDSLCQVGIEQIEVDGYPEIWFSEFLVTADNNSGFEMEKPWTKWAGCLSEIPQEERDKIRRRIEEAFSVLEEAGQSNKQANDSPEESFGST